METLWNDIYWYLEVALWAIKWWGHLACRFIVDYFPVILIGLFFLIIGVGFCIQRGKAKQTGTKVQNVFLDLEWGDERHSYSVDPFRIENPCFGTHPSMICDSGTTHDD